MVLNNPSRLGDSGSSSSDGKVAIGGAPSGEQPVPDSSDSPTLADSSPVSELLSASSDADSPTVVDLSSPVGPPVGGVRTPGAQTHPLQFELMPGMVVGERYELLAVLGEGGMGAVYKAKDRELDRLVALKVIRPELAGNPDILQRFKQEILLSSKVTHRNVIRIYDLGDAEGIKFITMEYVEGEDLRTILRSRGKLPVEEAVNIIEQTLAGLAAAHREGI